jgi:PqqD family protein of HPr-rel-A system
MSANPKRKGEMTGATGPEGWAIYDASTSAVHFLNDSARAIWELCDGKTTIEEMALAISSLTGITTAEARSDVAKTVDRLRCLGLVRT